MKEPGIFELNVDDPEQYAKIQGTLMGTNTFKVFNISPLHYQQMDVVSFQQMRIEQFLTHVSNRL